MSANFSKVINMDSKLKTDIETIAKHYGPNVQMIKFAEEAAELSAAVHKCIVYSELSHEHQDADKYFDAKWSTAFRLATKEMADVFILAKQFEYFASQTPEFKKDIDKFMEEKVKRQLERIEEEKAYAAKRKAEKEKHRAEVDALLRKRDDRLE